jgi:peptidyl-prolyl cis-trans isomerase A (cyclophilin A)
MIRRLACLALACAAIAACGSEQRSAQAPAAEQAAVKPATASEPLPDKVRVRLETGLGPIVVELDAKHAPITAANFLRYVREGRFDGTTFYRAARTKGQPGHGFIQGGIRRNYQRMLPPIAHEPTSKTGLRHIAGTISMARAEEGAGAMGDFFITLSPQPAMDAHGKEPGYAAFGRVVEGMDVARRILEAPTIANAGRGAMKGQMIEKPVPIVRARVQVDEGLSRGG